MTKRRKTTLIMVVFLLVAAIVAGATFAWLNDRKDLTNSLSYVASSAPDPDRPAPVGIQLAEPHWSSDSAYQFNNYKDPDKVFYGVLPNTEANQAIAAPTNDASFPKFGVALGVDFIPGRVMPKDPTVRAVGQLPTYVGIKVSGSGDPSENLTMEELELLYQFNWNSVSTNLSDIAAADGKWVLVHTDSSNGDKYFVYNKELISYEASTIGGYGTQADMTPALFTSIVAKPNSAANGNVNVYKKITYNDANTPKSFGHDILVTAFSVQSRNDLVTNWNPLTALIAEFGTGTSADNTTNTAWAGALTANPGYAPIDA